MTSPPWTTGWRSKCSSVNCCSLPGHIWHSLCLWLLGAVGTFKEVQAIIINSTIFSCSSVKLSLELWWELITKAQSGTGSCLLTIFFTIQDRTSGKHRESTRYNIVYTSENKRYMTQTKPLAKLQLPNNYQIT